MKAILLGTLLFGARLFAEETATVINAAAPGYPQMASGGRLEGEVAVDLEVTQEGIVRKVQAQTGPPMLNP